MSVRVVLYDDPKLANRYVLGIYEKVGVDPHIFAGRPGCRLFDERGKEIARLIVGWQALGQDLMPYGRKWARMDVEAV